MLKARGRRGCKKLVEDEFSITCLNVVCTVFEVINDAEGRSPGVKTNVTVDSPSFLGQLCNCRSKPKDCPFKGGIPYVLTNPDFFSFSRDPYLTRPGSCAPRKRIPISRFSSKDLTHTSHSVELENRARQCQHLAGTSAHTRT